MIPRAELQTKADVRRQPRSSIFLTAVMRTGTEQEPVKVRNMSANGAMIESTLSPAPGTVVQLIRGALRSQGTVMWSSDNRSGLHFPSAVSVKEWLTAPAKVEQQRVDEIVSLIKTGAILPLLGNVDDAQASPSRPSEEQLVNDLGAVIRLMQDLEDALTACDETLERHATKLQNLDIAIQTIRAIGQQLTANPSSEPLSGASLESLRVVCAHALGTR